MSKKRKPVHISPQEDAQSVALLAFAIGLGLAYVGAEIGLVGRPHFGHWVAAGIAGVVAGGLGYGITLWQRLRR